MPMKQVDNKIWLEPKELPMPDPFFQGGKTVKQIFDENPTVQAIWILKPEAREPFRVPFRNAQPRRRQTNNRGPARTGARPAQTKKEGQA